MKVKYVVLFVVNGRHNHVEFARGQKAEAIAAYKNIRMRADWIKLLSIDSDDSDIVYDLSNNY